MTKTTKPIEADAWTDIARWRAIAGSENAYMRIVAFCAHASTIRAVAGAWPGDPNDTLRLQDLEELRVDMSVPLGRVWALLEAVDAPH